MSNDILCFSHLRWGFVYQRPNHLMARAARNRRVWFFEEPVEAESVGMTVRDVAGLKVVTPTLPAMRPGERERALSELVDALIRDHHIEQPVTWYYTPMALPFSAHVSTSAIVYDCMDELSGFMGAPARLRELERLLMARAGLVFAGGRQLYEARRNLHPAIQLHPSSVDRAHFSAARRAIADPDDQATIARPRLGYAGVIDERLDLDLVEGVASAHPEWQLVMLGPVAKIDAARLPRGANLHWLGQKAYAELPAYLGNWQAGLMPFAHNEATRFISPTKTPEYLAAGLPVVSTSIRDVVRPYGEQGLVEIGDGAEGFAAATERALATDPERHRAAVDAFLAHDSWDLTWARMDAAIERVLAARARSRSAAATWARPAATVTSRSPWAGTPGMAGRASVSLGGRDG